MLAGLLPGGGRGLTPDSGPGRRSRPLTIAVLGLRVLPGRVEERVFPLGRVGGGGRRRRRGAGLGVEDERVPLRHRVQTRGRGEERGGGRGATTAASAAAAGRSRGGGLDHVASTLHPLEELLQLPLLLHALHPQQLELTRVDGYARRRLLLSGHHFRQHALDLVQAVQRVELGQLREALELLVRVGEVEGGVRQSRVVEEVEVGEVHLRLVRSWNTCIAREKKTVRDVIAEARKTLTHRLYTVISLFLHVSLHHTLFMSHLLYILLSLDFILFTFHPFYRLLSLHLILFTSHPLYVSLSLHISFTAHIFHTPPVLHITVFTAPCFHIP